MTYEKFRSFVAHKQYDTHKYESDKCVQLLCVRSDFIRIVHKRNLKFLIVCFVYTESYC